jgi:hypothetical protein
MRRRGSSELLGSDGGKDGSRVPRDRNICETWVRLESCAERRSFNDWGCGVPGTHAVELEQRLLRPSHHRCRGCGLGVCCRAVGFL